jgi:hypothetical protein
MNVGGSDRPDRVVVHPSYTPMTAPALTGTHGVTHA